MTRLTVFLLSTLALGSLLLVVGCGEEPAPPPPLPTGVQTMTGVLLSTELSVTKRGTHVLRVAGKPVCFVESTIVNLRSFEGKEVQLHGTFAYNTDPLLLPVLVVTSATPIEQETRNLPLPSLGITCTIPTDWGMTTQGSAILFLPANATIPLVSVKREKGSTLPSGAPFLLAGKHGVRTTNANTGEETIAVLAEDTVLTFHWFPPLKNPSDELRAQWSAFLASIRFSESSSSRAPSTGSGVGMPCGGTAGILCPSGEFCAIEDVEENIGHCRKVR